MRSLSKDSIALAPTVSGTRPCLAIAKYLSLDGERVSLLPFTSRSNRTYPAPGWVVVHQPNGGLDVDSHLRLDMLKISASDVECEIGSLQDTDYVTRIRSNLGALLSGLTPAHPHYWKTFLPELDPPSHRAPKFSGTLRRLYTVLRQAGWRSPERGDILACPVDHVDFGGEHWLVVSNTEFNQRFRYPHIFVVQLYPTMETGVSLDVWKQQNRVVIPAIDGSSDALVAFEESLFCLDLSQEWLGKCDRCYSLEHHRPFNLLVGGGRDRRCLWCDGGVASWPTRVGSVGTTEMELLNGRLAIHFDLWKEDDHL